MHRQVFQRAPKQRLDRLAIVDIKRAAIGQHHVEIMRATKDVVPRQPIDNFGRALAQKGESIGNLGLVHTHHAMGGDHALGVGGGPRGEQDFAHRIGANGGMGLINIALPLCQRLRHGAHRAGRAGIGAGQYRDTGQLRQHQRIAIAGWIIHKQKRRLYLFGDIHQPVMGARDQRILLGHGHAGAAHILGGQSHQRMIYRIARQHQHRAIARLVQQPSPQGAHGLQGFAVAKLAPPRPRTFGNEHRIWGGIGPMVQPGASAAGHRAQRVARCQDQAAISLRLAIYRLRGVAGIGHGRSLTGECGLKGGSAFAARL